MRRRVVISVLRFRRTCCYHLQGRKDSFETFDKFLACVVNMVTRLKDGRSGVRIPAGAASLSLFQNVQSGSFTHPASHSLDAECSFSGEARVK